ncbi:hypothetical protein JYU34_001250 [Plutella xylostella]|uniref:FP protein C-terminal domain-containing protein n=1 Tax=Plutella xylostella TaxID=51655 RepID=A0ABQ7R6K5_PLUXY|nr:hypothetical protein JYU34_001250 [Plutella xylostella]
MDCSTCTKPAKTDESLKCINCHGNYHYYCNGITEVEFKKLRPINKQKWKCYDCKDSNGKSNSPVIPVQKKQLATTGPATATSITNADLAKLIDFMEEKFNAQTENFSNFKTTVTDQLSALTSVVNSWEHRIQQLENSTQQLADNLNSLKSQDNEISSLHNTIDCLQEQLNTQEQLSLRKEIEICGIPEFESENLIHTVLVSAQKIGVELTVNDIDYVTRVGPKSKPDAAAAEPRPVVARLLRNNKRDEILHASKVRRNLSTGDIGLGGTARKVYFNERLTKVNRHLFREARNRSKQSGYKFCWVKNGSIYVRKEDQKYPKLIRNTNDLEQILGPISTRVPINTTK